MRKIYWLVFKSYVGPLVLTFFISLFILLMQFLWKYIDDLVGKGLEWYVIAQLLFYASATFVPLALPLAILLSSLMTFGNLGEHYELVAMKSSGISLRKIMMPLVILSIIISISAFFFSNNMLPRANLKFFALLHDIKQTKLTLNIREGIFYNGIEGYTIRVGKKEDDGKTIHDVMIYDHSQRMGNSSLTTAKTGTMELSPDKSTLIFTLFNGNNYEEIFSRQNYRINRPFQRATFDDQYRRFSGLNFAMNRTDEAFFRNNYQMMNLDQLKYSKDSLNSELQKRKIQLSKSVLAFVPLYKNYIADTLKTDSVMSAFPSQMVVEKGKKVRKEVVDIAIEDARMVKNTVEFSVNDVKARKERINKHGIEYHRKFTLSFACLVLFFIGAPLGALIRKGGFGLPMVVSVIFFVFFHVLSIIGEKYARAGVVDPAYGMWFASTVLLPLGVFLTYKATTDSPLLDTEAWTKLFKRLSFKSAGESPNGN